MQVGSQGTAELAAYFERPGAWQRKGGTRRETLEVLAMSRAVMLLACARRGIPAHELEVHTVRHRMFGRVDATSDDILALVRRSGLDVPLRPRGGPDLDIANAIVIALYGLLAPASQPALSSTRSPRPDSLTSCPTAILP